MNKYSKELIVYVQEIPKNISSTLSGVPQVVIWNLYYVSALFSVLEIFLGILCTMQLIFLKWLFA